MALSLKHFFQTSKKMWCVVARSTGNDQQAARLTMEEKQPQQKQSRTIANRCLHLCWFSIDFRGRQKHVVYIEQHQIFKRTRTKTKQKLIENETTIKQKMKTTRQRSETQTQTRRKQKLNKK